mgnify:CR=1 FL=1
MKVKKVVKKAKKEVKKEVKKEAPKVTRGVYTNRGKWVLVLK